MLILTSFVLVGITLSEFPPETPGIYSPWGDLNDDGIIDIFDIVWLSGRYQKTGTPVNKTELLYNVSDTFAELRAQIAELQTQIQTLNTSVVALNSTITYFNTSIAYLSETATRFLYSDELPVDLWITSGVGTTGWVTIKSMTIPPNTLLNRTVLMLLSWMAYKTLSPQFLGFGRLTVNGIVTDSWDIYMIETPDPDIDAHFTTCDVKKLENIDNSVEVTIDLQFKIDSYGVVPQSGARIVTTEFRVFG